MILIKKLGKVPSSKGIRSQSLYQCVQCKTTYQRLDAEMKNHKEKSVCKSCYQVNRRDKALGNNPKVCSKCFSLKPYDHFYFKNKEKTHRNNVCKSCKITESKKYSNKLPKDIKYKWRRTSHAKSYGLTLKEFDNYFINAYCGICGRKESQSNRLVLDHCHTTGKIRGVLCDNCNKGLGLFMDNPLLLKNAINWLSK